MKPNRHRQAVGDGARLIHPPSAGPADVKFLQADDIRLVLGDDGSDSIDVKPTIHADASMHIVGEETHAATG